MASNMTQRVLFALVAIPLVLLVLWQGGIALVLLVCVAASVVLVFGASTFAGAAGVVAAGVVAGVGVWLFCPETL